jgi:Kef-type K+ transport system membrane component KefB
MSTGQFFFTTHARTNPRRQVEALDAIGKVSFALFIPVYFAVVGLKLDLVRGVSLWMMLAFIAGTCIVKLCSVSLAARFAGFRGLDLINLAITTNARGGPGIVLASVAFDASGGAPGPDSRTWDSKRLLSSLERGSIDSCLIH